MRYCVLQVLFRSVRPVYSGLGRPARVFFACVA